MDTDISVMEALSSGVISNVWTVPLHSPWLMPLEAIFGYLKHQVVGDRLFDTITALRAAVERYFTRRIAPAKERRDAALTTA